jgi:hypothetical protein
MRLFPPSGTDSWEVAQQDSHLGGRNCSAPSKPAVDGSVSRLVALLIALILTLTQDFAARQVRQNVTRMTKERLDINSASVDELKTIPGIGMPTTRRSSTGGRTCGAQKKVVPNCLRRNQRPDRRQVKFPADKRTGWRMEPDRCSRLLSVTFFAYDIEASRPCLLRQGDVEIGERVGPGLVHQNRP